MIRTVPTGDLGLDILLGGGWRLVKRFEERESATVVVRGGSGAGKTLMAIQVALELAHELDGDVAVGCVEILPTEYVAQLQSARPTLAADRVALLPLGAAGDGPRVYVGLLPDLDLEAPDLVTALEALEASVLAAGGKPKAFIVDSLIEDYGIGSSAARIDVDDVLKFAVRYGHALVLCEEVATDGPSPWVFAADTVLQLGVDAGFRGRWVEVRKHRFGPSATGRHELDVARSDHPQVFPGAPSWRLQSIGRILQHHGWEITKPSKPPVLVLDHNGLGRTDIHCAFAVVVSNDVGVSRRLALSLKRTQKRTGKDLVYEFEPLAHWREELSSATFDVEYLPVPHGPARGLRMLVERFSDVFRRGQSTCERVLLGDVGQCLGSDEAAAWVEVLRTFATLVALTGWQIPVIAYDGLRHEHRADAQMSGYADFAIDIDVRTSTVTMTRRWPRTTERFVVDRSQLDEYAELGALRDLTRDGTPEIW